MSRKYSILPLFFLSIAFLTLWTSSICNAQRRLTGCVTNADNEALISASVRLQGTRVGTATDSDGRFLLSGDWSNGAEITFSYIGYETKSVKYNGQKVLNIRLNRIEEKLDEVVVKANVNINAIDLRAKSGVVNNVDMKRLNERPLISMALALQGMVPGLNVSNTGELGATPKIRIRGNSSLRRDNTTNEPLYILDGQMISAETFYNLNPADISAIKVLKDAAACALYGIRAANGVLEITSKRGYQGKTSVNYNMSVGITTRGRRGIRMMDSAEKLELERLLENPAAPGYRYSADYYNKYFANDPNLQELIQEGKAKLDRLRSIHTDWFKELLHNNIYQKHSLSVKGGNSKTTYCISGNYTYQGGRIRGNDKRKLNTRMSLDQKVGKIGFLMLTMNGGYALSNTPNGPSSDPTSLIYNLNPYEQKSGELYSYPGRTYQDMINQYRSDINDKNGGFSATLTLDPLSGLNIAAVVGVDLLLSESHQFTPGSSYSESHSGIPELARGIYSKGKQTTTNLTSNVRVTYTHTFNKVHDLTIGANTDYYHYVSDGVYMTGYGVGDIDLPSAINQALHGYRQPTVSNPRDKSAQMGFGAVSGYSYKNTYDLYATYKADASSILPKDKRWNSAWAVGIGWTPTNYTWLKDNKVLSKLNLRASYGVTTNINGITVSTTVGSFAYDTQGYENIRPLSLISLYNKDLKPEQNKSADIDLTLGLFKKITVNVNWYNRKTEQALLDVPIPTSTGYSLLKRNIGVLENRGIELGIDANLIDTYECRLNFGANIAYNCNKVLNLYYADKIFLSENSLVPDYEIGKSYDMLYGLHSLGINPLTGYPVFRTGDGTEKQGTEVLTKSDFVPLGHLTPPYSGSFNIRFTYKSFDLDADFYYVCGGVQRFNYQYVRNMTEANLNAVAGQSRNMWFKPGDENKIYWTPFYSNATAEENLVQYANSRTIGNSDYLKLSMLSLRYRLSGRFLHRYLPFIQFANFSLQCSNLFTWTSYKESDPESGMLAGTTQPVFTFNMNLTF